MAVRPERVPAEEVRQRMLDAGRELALEVGAALTIERLRLEEVIQRARVPRSSVYRIWPYREDYIDDLLCYLAGAGSWFRDRTVLDPETFAIARQIIVENMHLLSSPEGRRSLIREVLRVTTTGNYRTLSESAPWRLHMALVATLGSTRTGEARRQIATALEDSQRRSRDSLVTVFDILAKVIGLRLRDPAWSASHMQLAGGLLVQSMALRNLQVQAALGADSADATADAELVDTLLNTPLPGPGLNGEPAMWTLTAFAYLGLFEAFVELDPDFVPPEELVPRQRHDAVAEHRHPWGRLRLVIARLALPEQARSVRDPAEVPVAEDATENGVDAARVGRRHPAQRQRRDRVLAQVGAEHVGVLAVFGERRVGEHRAQHAVLGHHDEPVKLVVDDPDGVELEEALRHHERGLARLAHRPVPAARRERRVAPPLVVGVEPSLRLGGRQHELVGAEERHKLFPVPSHVLPALRDLFRVAEDELGFSGGHVDRQPGHLPRVGPRVAGLAARREPGRIVPRERKQGSREEPAADRRLVKSVDAVLKVVHQVQRGDRAARARSPAPQLKDSANVVIGPVEH
jgi:hypothetical protein